MNTKNKISYTKPKIQDLGPVTELVGGLCIGGEYYVPYVAICNPQGDNEDYCDTHGNSAGDCNNGYTVWLYT